LRTSKGSGRAWISRQGGVATPMVPDKENR
jgi:hypothetical protein